MKKLILLLALTLSPFAAEVVRPGGGGSGTASNASNIVATAGYLLKATGTNTAGNSGAFDSGGFIGIGTTSPGVALHIVGESAAGAQERIDQYGDSTRWPILNLRKALGTKANPTNVTQWQTVGEIRFPGWMGTDFVHGAKIGSIIDAAINTNENFIRSGVSFSTTVANDDGTERMRITSAGKVGIGTTNPATVLDVTGTANFTGATTLGSTLSTVGAITAPAVTITNTLTVSGTNLVGTTLANMQTAINTKGTGSVTSVGLTMPADFSVANSPVTGAATLTVTRTTQTANTVQAGPASGSAATPSYRALVAADIPTALTVASIVATNTLTLAGTNVQTTLTSLQTQISATPGTVTSVGLQFGGVLYSNVVPGSPITTSGTLSPGLVVQTANTVLAGPTSGGTTAPTFRALVAADLPSSLTLSGTIKAAGNWAGFFKTTTNYTAASTDTFINVDASGGARTITLPSAANGFSSPYSQLIHVKKIDSSGNAVTVTVTGGATNIDGATTDSLISQYDSNGYYSDGTQWWKQ